MKTGYLSNFLFINFIAILLLVCNCDNMKHSSAQNIDTSFVRNRYRLLQKFKNIGAYYRGENHIITFHYKNSIKSYSFIKKEKEGWCFNGIIKPDTKEEIMEFLNLNDDKYAIDTLSVFQEQIFNTMDSFNIVWVDHEKRNFGYETSFFLRNYENFYSYIPEIEGKSNALKEILNHSERIDKNWYYINVEKAYSIQKDSIP